MRAAFLFLLIGGALAVAVIEAAAYVALHRQHFGWTRLDLDDPFGRATPAKLAALRTNPARCKALLADVGDADRPAPPVRHSATCGYADGMRLLPDDGRSLGFEPAAPIASCAMAASLLLWERDVVQPAAERHFGAAVTAIEHFGSYSCRRINGRADGEFSEHATANAFDVAGFTLAGGETVTVLRDWNSRGPEAAFLREVRDGACRLFATTLSPDYNAAHANHLHFDQARRGGNWRLCR